VENTTCSQAVAIVFILKCLPIPLIFLQLKRELGRCKEEQLFNIQHVLRVLAEELESLWERCFWDQSERAEFNEGLVNMESEAQVTAHEARVRELQEYLKSNLDLLNSVREYQALWIKWESLELSDNPGRFSNRGGALLAEERVKRKTKKSLLTLESKMVKLAEEFELKNPGKVFMVLGQPIADWLALLRESLEVEKNKQKDIKVT
jgi:protein regulator of cytokinesis 1